MASDQKYRDEAALFVEEIQISSSETETTQGLTNDENEIFAEVSKERIYAEGVIGTVSPCIKFMYPFLRFPIQVAKNFDGTYTFEYHPKSLAGKGFFITGTIVIIIAILVVINIFGFMTELPLIQKFEDPRRYSSIWGNYRYEERYIYRRNVIPVIIILTNSIHAGVTCWNLFKKMNFAASYLTFWTEAVESFQIDVSFGLRRYTILLICCYGGSMALLTILCAMRFAPVASGGPATLAMLVSRCFYPAIHTLDNFWIIRGFSGIVFIYLLITCRSLMLLFIVLCRLLRNGFLVWNHRLDRVLHRGELGENNKTKHEHRTSFDDMFKDHLCLVDLLEGADTLFANIIESYLVTQSFSTIFEAYYFYKSLTSGEDFKGARLLDALIIGLYFIHSFAMFYTVSIAATEVGEEVAEGLEILRRKPLMGKKTVDELYFTLSMYNSYACDKQSALAGAGYFVVDKGLLFGILFTVLSYLIILSQFSPLLLLTKINDKAAESYENSRLLRRIENTHDYFGLEVGV